jgi:putative membrane protein
MSRTHTIALLSALSSALSLSLCAGLALLAAPAPSAAQAASQPAASGAAKTGAVAAADKEFVHKAAIGGMAEVERGKLAQQKAASEQVKQFGSRMVDDHSKANDELKQVATSKGLTLPTDLDAKHKSKMAKLEKLSGAQFDRAYMDEMVDDHKKDVAEFEKQSKSGHDADIKGFASKTLPTLQEHLKLAQSADAAVKGKKSASR